MLAWERVGSERRLDAVLKPCVVLLEMGIREAEAQVTALYSVLELSSLLLCL